MTTQLLDRRTSERLVVSRFTQQMLVKYPHLPARQVAKLAKQCAKKALKSAPGGQIMLVRNPGSRWQRFKENHAPKWFVRAFPVKYSEGE